LKLLLDMNLSPRLLEPLAAAGHEVLHWQHLGQPGASDAEVMEWARRHGTVVVTHDLDFSAMLAASRAGTPSVVQVRSQDTLSTGFIELLRSTLTQFEELLGRGAIVVVDERGRRARALPLR
jgi:predicted nuclease of predicted toxin-antitoxin system